MYKFLKNIKYPLNKAFLILIIINISCSSKNIKNKSVVLENSKPNILFILTDDAGYHDYGFQGSKEFITPEIDKLVSSGVFCTSGYVSASVCGPSRAGLLTGRYQQRFGYFLNPKNHHNLPKNEYTMAEAIKNQGYKTGMIGKWHMGFQEGFHPNN
tara:strand:+ start:1432 stop:1899 length:468 start_codon:yes stop_codon:yes gene_type:complete